jgi:NAD+ kinase
VAGTALRLRRVGIVVHPTRELDVPLAGLDAWTRAHGAELVQVPVPGVERELAPAGTLADCDLIVSIGGDGTMLAALRAAIESRRPVLGVACGSLGVLTRTPPHEVEAALDEIAAGRFHEVELPALDVRRAGEPAAVALNDLSVVRNGIGQIRVTASLDGALLGRVAGDGVVVATPLGSSAYSLAAGGPLLSLGMQGFVFTPLSTHGGSIPPFVAGPDAHLELDVDGGFGGARVELDGQALGSAPTRLELSLRSRVGAFVLLDGHEPQLAVLRRRGILSDSPRIRAHDLRSTA